jgi:hypothetical protein
MIYKFVSIMCMAVICMRLRDLGCQVGLSERWLWAWAQLWLEERVWLWRGVRVT